MPFYIKILCIGLSEKACCKHTKIRSKDRIVLLVYFISTQMSQTHFFLNKTNTELLHSPCFLAQESVLHTLDTQSRALGVIFVIALNG